jgi:hypothetical protein
MNIKTKFNIGDIVYTVGRTYTTDRYAVRADMQIDLISIDVSSGGMGESYGCDETNELYSSQSIFKARADALAYAKKLNHAEGRAIDKAFDKWWDEQQNVFDRVGSTVKGIAREAAEFGKTFGQDNPYAD